MIHIMPLYITLDETEIKYWIKETQGIKEYKHT